MIAPAAASRSSCRHNKSTFMPPYEGIPSLDDLTLALCLFHLLTI
jgi:hypothetical protein